MKTSVKIISLLLVVIFLFTGCTTTIRLKVQNGSEKEVSSEEDLEVIAPVPDDVAELEDKGFGSYVQSHLDSKYPERKPVKGDVTRANAPYKVTSERLGTAVDKLAGFVSGDMLASMLNLNGSLEDMLGGVLDNLYTDDVVNMLIQYLFPVVVDQFINIWENTLPAETFIGNDQLKGGGTDVNLRFYDLESSVEKLSLYVFPNIMAEHIPHIKEDYPEVYSALSAVTTKATLETNPWKDPAVYDEETGKLLLKWGVHDYESFIKASDTALKALEPLLLALFAGKDVSLTTFENPDGIGNGDGEGKFGLLPIIKVSIEITRITLNLSAKGCSGYNDALVPLFELLGADDIRDGDKFETVEDIFRGILEPVQEILGKIGRDPLNAILELLPNFAYGIKANLLNELLGMISADINYSADGDYIATVFGGKYTAAEGTVEGAYKCDEPIPINFADILNLESMGIDMSSINGLLDSVMEMAKLELKLPEINDGLLASLGELQVLSSGRTTPVYGLKEGERYYIAADKADIVYAILNWLLNAVKNDAELLPSILKLAKVDSLPDMVNDIIKNATKDTDNTVAAIVELLAPNAYTQPHVNYPDAQPYIVESSALYNTLWTKSAAELTYKNLGTVVDKLMGLFGNDSLGSMINGLLSGNVFTNEMLNNLSMSLKDLLNSKDVAPLLDTVMSVLDLVTIDGYSLNVAKIKETINFFKNFKGGYDFGFEDGDGKGFVKAIVDKIRPLFPLLKFVLSNSTLGILGIAETYGGKGYGNGIVPILEALGCENILSYSDYYKKVTANADNLIYGITDPLLALIDKICLDPVTEIVNLLPNICYFIEIGGIDQALDALLFPVQVVLDTVRPIYSVEFSLKLTDTIKDAVKGINVGGISLPDINFADFITGEAEKYTSASGFEAIRIKGDGADTVSALINYLKGALGGLVSVDSLGSMLSGA